MAADILSTNLYITHDLTKPWIYSLSIIEGFVTGAAAMAMAYFGDETPLNTAIEIRVNI